MSLLVVLLGVVVLVFAVQRWVLFPRHLITTPEKNPRDVQGLEEIWLTTDAGRVEAWFLPGDGVSAAKPGPAVLFAHGNGELIDHWPSSLAPYRRMGFSVLLIEYRGYGRSAGSPSEQAIVSDAIAFHDLLVQRPEVDRQRILFHGRSLGGGVTCALAAHRKPRAMILMSTFTSVRELARRYLVPSFLVRDPFESLEVVARLRIPLLVLHGERDTLVPVQHAKRLAAANPKAKLILYDAPHNMWPASLYADLEPFLQEAGLM